ncbi:hypothetical protein [Streptomyces sp. G-5]|uniref:hypothetical protein n=1 Tax=Streptomyces sp. G-5 TaxID=2977231 RepID=UPI0021CF0A5D|nr:hypothetical protein [Streptomyces sp. G-5]MCU4750289.1 hypothetical protein [Streptomyces sp. G-5]
MQHLPKNTRGKLTRVAPSAYGIKGRRVLAVGSINGRSDLPCCGGVDTIKVRIDGKLHTMVCRTCHPQGLECCGGFDVVVIRVDGKSRTVTCGTCRPEVAAQ